MFISRKMNIFSSIAEVTLLGHRFLLIYSFISILYFVEFGSESMSDFDYEQLYFVERNVSGLWKIKKTKELQLICNSLVFFIYKIYRYTLFLK
ncbi:hypothetical protein Pedsa_0647 [Pseudopedobacter saltans DSM 12145]|uniref:Uncharacterized protein n=1 Tax=Pseudopedobacter saltans (strain ATCC 51119 / DSM 12145 / JCM 21818 / CCUG 39354 / LMG 10337 / NBRC 100064 / NCIMB 13643) TaxID=762903 RepID=F0S802_PSESL|nr:hypothetical protein Pedsa_0647 [Pseudopedobacter saltans DSM 12145]